ncbi:HTH-type transcriptional regulator LeuO [Pigmentiphaga humi]|uniref:HTH-type transcriptional regulator LeuO n=1 Tax=Pigmentiphaga humi TaxID=2478468 RepID=A0A3P4AZ68_9BURK|nr:LysR family transcriptional regulator [Pigmentiphaga humi]VCU68125.1 HTH-type transcriptional regulator LeuO [Pigmentiphaga humi]
MQNIDTKLLRVFDEIRRTGSVSAAAERMGMSQSTMSFFLARLRALFDDPLFVRTSAGMEPTARARELEPPVAAALAAMQALMAPTVFDPATSARVFRLCMTDISHIVLLPRIVNRLREAAPAARIEVQRIGPDTPARMEEGEADLSIGFMPQLDAGFYRQRLFEQDFVCVAALRHPRIGKVLTAEDFAREGHIDVSPSTTSQLIVEQAIRRAGLAREVVLRLPSYLGLAAVLAQTDLVATVPGLLGEICARQEGLALYAPPIAIERYAVNQYWHARWHRDPGHAWLRQMLAELFLQGGAPAAAAVSRPRRPAARRAD